MQVASGVQGGSRVAQGPVNADSVEGDLGWGHGEALTRDGVGGQPGGGLFGFCDHLQGAVTVAGLSGVVCAGAQHLGVGGRLGGRDQPGRF